MKVQLFDKVVQNPQVMESGRTMVLYDSGLFNWGQPGRYVFDTARANNPLQAIWHANDESYYSRQAIMNLRHPAIPLVGCKRSQCAFTILGDIPKSHAWGMPDDKTPIHEMGADGIKFSTQPKLYQQYILTPVPVDRGRTAAHKYCFGSSNFYESMTAYPAQPQIEANMVYSFSSHRFTPGLHHKPMAERQRLLGTKRGVWVDKIGPISMLSKEEFQRLFQFNPGQKHDILHTKYGHRADKPTEYRLYRGATDELLKGNRFTILTIPVGIHSQHYNKIVVEHMTILVGVGIDLYDAYFGPASTTVAQIQRWVEGKDATTWNKVVANKVGSSKQKGPGPVNIHPTMKHVLQRLPTGDNVNVRNAFAQRVFSKQTKYLKREDWQNTMLPRLVQRIQISPRDRKILNILDAKKGEVKTIDHKLTLAEEEIVQETSAIELRKKQIVSSTARIVQAKQQLVSHKAEVEKFKKVITKLEGQLSEPLSFEAKVEKARGLETTDLYENWKRRNWLILEATYGTPTGKILSIRDNPDLAVMPGAWLKTIRARTIKPHRIKVGATTGRYEDYDDVVGGPYEITISRQTKQQSARMTIRLAEPTAVFGFKEKREYNDLAEVSIFPHSQPQNVRSTDPNRVAGLWLLQPSPCLGQASGILTQALHSSDLNAVLSVIHSWITNADPLDDWATRYKYFPKFQDFKYETEVAEMQEESVLYAKKVGDYYRYAKLDTNLLTQEVTLSIGSIIWHKGEWVFSHKVKTSVINTEKSTSTIAWFNKRGYSLTTLDTLNPTQEAE